MICLLFWVERGIYETEFCCICHVKGCVRRESSEDFGCETWSSKNGSYKLVLLLFEIIEFRNNTLYAWKHVCKCSFFFSSTCSFSRIYVFPWYWLWNIEDYLLNSFKFGSFGWLVPLQVKWREKMLTHVYLHSFLPFFLGLFLFTIGSFKLYFETFDVNCVTDTSDTVEISCIFIGYWSLCSLFRFILIS